ncbi:MAG TPA: ATP-binding protein [Candidatus Deferrimicrobiaceae bacterium]|jgi:PAS domain S-box-containing protein
MGRFSSAPARKAGFALLLFLLAAICVGLFTVIFENAKRDAVEQLNERQRIHARQAASGIEESFRNWTAILASLARIDDVVDVTPDGRADLDFFQEAHRDQVLSISRISETGVILYTVPFRGSIGSSIAGQAHVRRILAERKPVVSDVFRTVQGFDGVALHVPVFRRNAFKGTIAVVVNFQSLAKRYLEVIRVGKTGYAWVASENGAMLYHPNPDLVGQSVLAIGKGNPSFLAMTRQMLAGREGIAEYTLGPARPNGAKPANRHAVYLPVHLWNTFWSVAVGSSDDEVLASLASFRNRLALFLVAVLASAVVLSTMGAKAWLIVREEGERRRVEGELRESERRYRELFEKNPAPMLIYEKGTFDMLAVNDAFHFLYGYDDNDIRGMRLPDLYPEEEKAPVVAMASRLTGVAYVGEWHHRLKDGSLITIVVRSHDVDYMGRKGRLGVITDISGLKRAEELLRNLNETLEQKVRARTAELEKANATLSELDRLKSLFIASMSHELRTPLNSIIGFTGILLQGFAGPLNEEQAKQLGMVKGSARHLLDLITDIIDLSKIEAGKIGLDLGPVDLAQVAREVLGEFRVAAAQKSVSLSIDAPDRLPIEADARRVRQVLINLVGNAVKFTEGGSVSVSLTQEEETATVAVRDTGPGIRPEDLGKLFRQFSQVGLAETPKHEGTGLGLYLSRKLMRMMQGDIRVESTFGRGSVFIATLPASRATEGA